MTLGDTWWPIKCDAWENLGKGEAYHRKSDFSFDFLVLGVSMPGRQVFLFPMHFLTFWSASLIVLIVG